MDLAHPFGVARSEIVVYGNNVNAATARERGEICLYLLGFTRWLAACSFVDPDRPLDAATAVRVSPGIDVEGMRAAAALLPGRHDFTAFARLGGSATHPFRRIDAAEWIVDGETLVFRIAGEGFLRGMVRALVGTMLEVGRGRRPVAGFA